LAAFTLALVRDLDHLEPYGAENPRPQFLAAGLEIVGDPKKMGGGERHLSFRVRTGATSMRAVAWSMAHRVEELLSANRKCCIAFVPRINEWQGNTKVEIEIVDFQPGERPNLVL
jgi:single-stranded-DNA-specific exonuclease